MITGYGWGRDEHEAHLADRLAAFEAVAVAAQSVTAQLPREPWCPVERFQVSTRSLLELATALRRLKELTDG
jgi:hypothetical protein